MTVEPYPRLSIVRARPRSGSFLGPLRSQRHAEVVRDAIHDAVPLRQCSDRLSLRRIVRVACALAGIGRCAAPCEGGQTPAQYAELVDLVARAWTGDVRALIEPLERKLAAASAAQRYEQAAVVRDRIVTVVRACARMQRLGALEAIGEIVVAHPDGSGGWELAVVRSAVLVASAVAERGVDPWLVVEAMRASADVVDPERAPLTEESECILRWIEQPGARLVLASDPWCMAAFGAGGLRRYLHSGRDPVNPLADRRRLPMASRPARPRLTA